jgi:AcrR family transcriptional regulator
MSSESLTIRAQQILHAARELLEDEGLEMFSMRRLAERLGIRAPSLYKHFPSKEALEAALLSEFFTEQAELFEAALRDTPEPLAEIARAYHAYALEHRQLFRLFTERAIDRSLITPGVEDRARAPGDTASGDPSLSRALWAFAHGMTILELNDRFPPGADLEAAWKRGLDAFNAAARPRAGRRRPRQRPDRSTVPPA